MTEFGFVKSGYRKLDKVADDLFTTVELPEEYTLSKYFKSVNDQGDQPICVSCVMTDIINWKLYPEKLSKSLITYFYDNRSDKSMHGMNPRDAFEILKTIGIRSKSGIVKKSNYARLKNYYNLKYSIIAYGPALLALPVYSMTDNFWEKTSNLLGYHAVTAVGYTNEGIIIRNSWGLSYGYGGYNVLPYDRFSQVIESWILLD